MRFIFELPCSFIVSLDRNMSLGPPAPSSWISPRLAWRLCVWWHSGKSVFAIGKRRGLEWSDDRCSNKKSGLSALSTLERK
jgi:hypothetical protein